MTGQGLTRPKGIDYTTKCEFTSLTLNYLARKSVSRIVGNRRLIIIDITSCTVFIDFYLLVLPIAKKEIYTDYFFIYEQSDFLRKFHLPIELKLRSSVYGCELQIKEQYNRKENAYLVIRFLANEYKKRILTNTEKDVARYLLLGYTLEEISKLRNVTVKTTYSQFNTIKKKIGVLTYINILKHLHCHL